MATVQDYIIEHFIFLIMVISSYFVVNVPSSVERFVKARLVVNMTVLLVLSVISFYIEHLQLYGFQGDNYLIARLVYHCFRPLPMVALIAMVDIKKRSHVTTLILNILVYITLFLSDTYNILIINPKLEDFLYSYSYIMTEWVYWIIFLFVLNWKLFITNNANNLGIFCLISILMTANIIDCCGIKSGILLETYALCFLLYYLMLHVYISQQINQEKDLKLREQRLSMMLSQIQPHFLYNTLNTITALCRTNPKLAENTTLKFSKYLRENMYGIEEVNTHPFAQELDHIKIYLDIEKLRFGKRLNVVYDIQDVDFDVPILTLQPIVENAVKHGICKRIEGGTVHISTRKYRQDHIITITDDGQGFVPEEVGKDGRKHIGISNAKERLKNIVGTKIDFSSIVGIGTKVTIIIPGEKSKDKNKESYRREIHSIGR